VELCLPLVRAGGRLLAQKTDKEDAAAAERAIRLLGGSLDAVVPAPSAARRSGTIVVISKISATPDAYPRRAGLPAKKPL
jgi:16S rRNA (guanine527-N7)-methyltransferase